MKRLILVTPSEFKSHFGEVIEMCTNICIAANKEIFITIPENKDGQTYVEIAKVTPVHGGVKYEYNHELLKKFGISINNCMNKLESIIKNAFEERKVFHVAGPKMEEIIDKAISKAVLEIMRQFNISF